MHKHFKMEATRENDHNERNRKQLDKTEIKKTLLRDKILIKNLERNLQ